MSISDRLDKIEARAQAATPADAETSLSMDGFDMHEDYPEYGQGQLMNAYMLGYDEGCADKSALLAAVRAVIDLHMARVTRTGVRMPYCVECGQTLPCPTVRALTSALGKEARNG